MRAGRLLAFTAGRVACAVDPAEVERILPLGPLLPVPAGPSWLLGLLEVKGRVRAVIDVGRRLFPADEPAPVQFLLVGDFAGVPCVLAVAEVAGIVPATGIAPPLVEGFPAEVAPFLSGTVVAGGVPRVVLSVPGLVAGSSDAARAAAAGAPGAC